MTYLERQCEIEKHDRLLIAKGRKPTGLGLRPVFEHLAAGDAELFDAMWSFANFAHAFDDLIDESGWNKEAREAAVSLLHDAVVRMDSASYLKLANFYWNAARRFEADDETWALAAFDMFFWNLRHNLFIQPRCKEIQTMLVQALTRCLDGDEMAADVNPERRALAPAVRCGDVDVIFHMVYLARGWAALRECSAVREYDIADEPKEAA